MSNVVLMSDPGTNVHPDILGVADVDRDGRGEVFVKVDQGASTEFFTIVRVVAGRLTQMRLGGEPLKLALFGSVTHNSVVGCSTGTLISAGWSTDDQFKTFKGERNEYHLRGE
jgi:hypothetical protein